MNLHISGFLSIDLNLTYRPIVCHSIPLWPARGRCQLFLNVFRESHRLLIACSPSLLCSEGERSYNCTSLPCALGGPYSHFSRVDTLPDQRLYTFLGMQPVTPVFLINPSRVIVFASALPLQQLLLDSQTGLQIVINFKSVHLKMSYCPLCRAWPPLSFLNSAVLCLGGYLLCSYQWQSSLAATSPSFVFVNLVVLFNALLCLFLSDPACAGRVGS